MDYAKYLNMSNSNVPDDISKSLEYAGSTTRTAT